MNGSDAQDNQQQRPPESINEYRLRLAEVRLDKLEGRLDTMAGDIQELKTTVAGIPALVEQSANNTIKWVVGTGVSVGLLIAGVIEIGKVIR